MRRWLRFGLFGVGGLVLVALVAVAFFVITFDPNTQKDRIVDAVRRATGRDLVLAGPLKLSLSWTPVLEAEDAAFANRAGGSRPQMATVARLSASMALMPLLSGRVQIESITLDRPDILLETDAQGVGNWQFPRPVVTGAPVDAAPSAPSSPHRRVDVAVQRVVVLNGRVTWRNEATGRSTTVDVAHATLTRQRTELHLVADATASGQPVKLDGIMVMDQPAGYPLRLKAAVAGAQIAWDGVVSLPLNAASYRGRVNAAVPDLAALAAVLRLEKVPPLRDVQLALTMADGLPQNVVLHAGRSDLGTYGAGVSLTALDLALPGWGQVGRISADGALPDGPWRISAGLLVNPNTVALRGIQFASPGTVLGGDVALSQGERWALRGTVLAQAVDWDALRQLRPASPPVTVAPVTPAPGPAAPPQGPARAFNAAPLPWGRLRQADADLQFSVGALRVGGVDYHGLTGHVTLVDGALRLDPLTVQAPEGRVDGSLVLDASQPEPPVALVLRSAAFALDPVLQAAGLPGGTDAPMEVDVALSSSGASWQSLASHLDGHIGLAMVDGTVSNAALSAALGGLIPKGAGRLEQGGRSSVRCLGLRLDAQDGQVNLAAMDLETNRLDLTGEGSLNLADETMALRLRPTIRVAGTGVTAPVQVAGRLTRPDAALDTQGVNGRAGLVIGGAPQPDACPAALTAARGGRPGPIPAPMAAKAPKASDLLRSFLR